MKSPQRSIWPWMVLGILALGTLVFVGSFVWRMLHPPVVPFAEEGADKHVQIQLEIVNASGIHGAGKRTMSYLRERGFDVVEVATDTHKVRASYILDRLGDRTSSIKVANVLGIPDSLVRSDIDSMRFLRASVVLGTDCTRLPPFAN